MPDIWSQSIKSSIFSTIVCALSVERTSPLSPLQWRTPWRRPTQGEDRPPQTGARSGPGPTLTDQMLPYWSMWQQVKKRLTKVGAVDQAAGPHTVSGNDLSRTQRENLQRLLWMSLTVTKNNLHLKMMCVVAVIKFDDYDYYRLQCFVITDVALSGLMCLTNSMYLWLIKK